MRPLERCAVLLYGLTGWRDGLDVSSQGKVNRFRLRTLWPALCLLRKLCLDFSVT